MDHIRRNDRMAVITKLLTDSPNKLQTMSQFCERFETAKSTMSEDVDILKKVFQRFGLGELSTVAGAAGGVQYRPRMSLNQVLPFLNGLCEELSNPSRLLPGGFLYFSDVLAMPEIVRQMGVIIAGEYYFSAPDFVLTMETKGIPVALMTAQAMGIPLVIARHSSKVYEGSAVNINYVSGSSGRIETMSLSRRAIKDGKKCLIVDDFIQAGATARGMMDLMKEFNVEVVGSAFVMARHSETPRMIQGEKALMEMSIKEDGTLEVKPARWITG